MGTVVDTWQHNLENNYGWLQPALLRVLASLSRQGYVVPVSDGLDYVHDFLLTQWPAILRTFDPRLGTLERYMSSAFERFVRTRIARQWRVQERLRDAQVIVDPGFPTTR